MENFQSRLDHWSTGYSTYNQGDSLAHPFLNYMQYFTGDILEIGPGDGRQAKAIMPKASSYSVADIVKEILELPIFKDCKANLLIRDWAQDYGIRFDTIHFWYLLHHIPRKELQAFVNFLYTHTKEKGKVIFNTPHLDYDKGNYCDNGVLTTPYKIGEVVYAFDYKFFCLHVDGTQNKNSNGHIYVGERRR